MINEWIGNYALDSNDHYIWESGPQKPRPQHVGV